MKPLMLRIALAVAVAVSVWAGPPVLAATTYNFPTLGYYRAYYKVSNQSYSNSYIPTVNYTGFSTNCSYNGSSFNPHGHANFSDWLSVNGTSGDWMEQGIYDGAWTWGGGNQCYHGGYTFWSLGGTAWGQAETSWSTTGTHSWSLVLINNGACSPTYTYTLAFVVDGVTQDSVCGANSYGTDPSAGNQVGWEWSVSTSNFTFTAPQNPGDWVNGFTGMEDYQPSTSTWFPWSQLTVTGELSTCAPFKENYLGGSSNLINIVAQSSC